MIIRTHYKKKAKFLWPQKMFFSGSEKFLIPRNFFFGREKIFCTAKKISLAAKNILYREEDFLWPRKIFYTVLNEIH